MAVPFVQDEALQDQASKEAACGITEFVCPEVLGFSGIFKKRLAKVYFLLQPKLIGPDIQTSSSMRSYPLVQSSISTTLKHQDARGTQKEPRVPQQLNFTHQMLMRRPIRPTQLMSYTLQILALKRATPHEEHETKMRTRLVFPNLHRPPIAHALRIIPQNQPHTHHRHNGKVHLLEMLRTSPRNKLILNLLLQFRRVCKISIFQKKSRRPLPPICAPLPHHSPYLEVCRTQTTRR